jgi:hypothetical protein
MSKSRKGKVRKLIDSILEPKDVEIKDEKPLITEVKSTVVEQPVKTEKPLLFKITYRIRMKEDQIRYINLTGFDLQHVEEKFKTKFGKQWMFVKAEQIDMI